MTKRASFGVMKCFFICPNVMFFSFFPCLISGLLSRSCSRTPRTWLTGLCQRLARGSCANLTPACRFRSYSGTPWRRGIEVSSQTIISIPLFLSIPKESPALLCPHHAALPASQTWPPVPLSEALAGCGIVCYLVDEHPQPVCLLPEEWTHWQTLHQPQQVSCLLWHQLVPQIHERPGFLWDMGSPTILRRFQCQECLLCPVRWTEGGHSSRGA